MHLLQTPTEQRRVAFRVSITISTQQVSYLVTRRKTLTIHSRFPKSDELLQKWLLAIGTKKITESSRICSRHFKEDEFRYSIVGGKRFLKQEAIPSLCLNEENKDDIVSDNQDTIVKENQPTNTMIEYITKNVDNEALDIVESCIEVKRDDELSKR